MTHARSVSLVDAFEATDYLVHIGDTWQQINIGSPCPSRLRHWLEENCGRPCAWLVTAYNPDARQLAEVDNQNRHAALLGSLDTEDYRYTASNSRAQDESWPDEPGVCILNADEGQARALSLRFGQAALVAIPIDGPVQLLWSNPASAPLKPALE